MLFVFHLLFVVQHELQVICYACFILDGVFHLFDARWPSESDAIELLARYVQKMASGLLRHATTLGHTYQIECQNICQTECHMG